MDQPIVVNNPQLIDIYTNELALFFKLYVHNFPDIDEREDPQIILDRIKYREQKNLTPETLILLSLSDKKVMGGAVLEYYTESKCFLLTYILVDDEFRGLGVARLLIEDGIKLLVEAKNSDSKAVFFESNIPWQTTTDSFDAWDRYQIFSKLGAKWIDINYTQPALGKDKKKVHNLHFFIFPLFSGLLNKLEKSVLILFMNTFYRDLGIPNPENDIDYQKMKTSINESSDDEYIELHEVPTRERDIIHFTDISVAYHFVETPFLQVRISKPENMPHCPVIGSYEFDLFRYSFQCHPPYRTHCLTSFHEKKCVIRFPQKITYNSEGRHETLISTRNEISVEIKLNCTYFGNGKRIWTIIFRPDIESYVSQDEVIKLISLFCRSQEKSNIVSETRFIFANKEFESLPEFVRIITRIPDSSKMEMLLSGIVEVDTSTCKSKKSKVETWKEAIAFINRISKNEISAYAHFEERYRDNEDMRQVLNLMCGFSLGIFDYSRMSFEEVIDTLYPLSSSGHFFNLLTKGILNTFSYQDDMYQKSKSDIGINPYLLITSVVLAFNDNESAKAESYLINILDETTSDHSLSDLIGIRKEMERKVNEEILTNIFHYPTERHIFMHGMEHRGIDDRVINIKNRLNELISLITDKIELQKGKANVMVTILLAAISILSFEGVFETFFRSIEDNGGLAGALHKDGIRWMIFLLFSLLAIVYIIYFAQRSIKRRN